MPQRRLSREDFDAMLTFLPLFESPDFVFGRIEREAGFLASSTYSLEVGLFVKRAHEHGWIYGFDWTEWMDEGRRYVDDPALVATANLRTLRRLLTMHIRGDRFKAGHLLDMHERGHLVAILHRMRELRP